MAKASIRILDEKYKNERENNRHLDNLFSRLEIEMNFFEPDKPESRRSDETLRKFQRIYLELLEEQRKLLDEMNSLSEFDEELIRKYLALIDLEELKIREKMP